jgi:hypothetical protein
MIDIFYKSYAPDFKLLRYSLESVKRNVVNYANIHVLIPLRDAQRFDNRNLPPNTTVHFVEEYGEGYLYQQWCKISAQKYCQSEYILFADSDCIFDHLINLEEFVTDGKPEILYTPYSKVGDAICWKKCTEDFMREEVEFEFMRRNTLIYHRSTLKAIAEYAPNLEVDIMQGKRFSEFNAMGAFAFKYEKDKYNFVCTDDWQYVEPKGVQCWSYGDPDGDELHKREYQRTLDTINRALNLNLTKL